MPSAMGAKLKHKERLIVGHPFNPPHLIPLVEIVGGAKTSRVTIDSATKFYRRLGKKTIELHKEVPGHVANRLQAALYREGPVDYVWDDHDFGANDIGKDYPMKKESQQLHQSAPVGEALGLLVEPGADEHQRRTEDCRADRHAQRDLLGAPRWREDRARF